MTDSSFKIIAIDGGAASGKSSTSKILCERFNLLYVNTGSHYRSITWALLQKGISHENESQVSETLNALPIGSKVVENEALMTVDGVSLSSTETRSEQVNNNVSHFAALPLIRQYLLDYQRSYVDVAKAHNFAGLIMEGRDIGSVIFPEADFRFFLFADAEERERRRANEGQTDAIKKRDELDQKRKTAPLLCTDGAVKVDTTHIGLQEVADKLSEVIRNNA